ncbi:DUF1983 domain-containing protein [Salinisphaera sp. SPP-AMP-43]|uniref:phage tail tip fiber protein n=1 Tax=Salinisphaera sp. SPP-AMP-43 TaxID=3121288 RepID=UPI003C6E6FF9
MPAKGKTAAIPAPTGVKDLAAQRALWAIYDRLQNFDPQQLKRDTQRIAQQAGAQASGNDTTPVRPNVPQNLQATGIFGAIILQIDGMPGGAAAIEWLAAPEDDLSKAKVVGQSAIPLFKHYVGDNATRWYWCRAVGRGASPLRSALNATEGTKGQSAQDPTFLREQLKNAISQDDLAEDLTTKIFDQGGDNLLAHGYFPNAEGNSGWGRPLVSVSGQPFPAAVEVSSRDAYDSDGWFPVNPGETLFFSCWINTTDAEVPCNFGINVVGDGGEHDWLPATSAGTGEDWGQHRGTRKVPSWATRARGWIQMPDRPDNYGKAQVANMRIARAQAGADVTAESSSVVELTKSVDNVSAQAMLKVESNGVVAGIGEAVGPTGKDGVTQSRIYFAANRIAFITDINDGIDNASFPLIARGKKVVINTALVENATIVDAHIKSVGANKVVADNLSAISADLGTVTAGRMRTVTNDGRVEVRPDGVFVYDGSGSLRVELGRLH